MVPPCPIDLRLDSFSIKGFNKKHLFVWGPGCVNLSETKGNEWKFNGHERKREEAKSK